MRHIFPCSLILASAIVAFACSPKSGAKGNGTPGAGPADDTDPGASPPQQEEAGTASEAGPPLVGEDPSGNPILLGAPKVVRSFTPPGAAPEFVDGPVWSAVRSQLFASLPFAANNVGGRGILTTFKSDGTNYTELRAGDTLTSGVIGNSIDVEGNLISAEFKSVTRTTLFPEAVGAVTVIAKGYTTIGGDAGAVTPFDTPNDLIALSDGTIYVTDPGYQVTPRPMVGHLFKIAPGAKTATVVASYDYNPSPNGIALSKDQTKLFVSFTEPGEGAPPFVRKYTINPDRSLIDGGKFVEVPLGSDPDGIAMDDNDNLYVALKTGIAVYKSTGEAYGGASAKIPQTVLDGATSVTFGGDDRMSLFVTTESGMVYELKTKVPGLLQ